MITIDPSVLSERDNYKFLAGSVLPRPVALITTLSKDGVLNAAPFSFFNVVTSDPPLISVAVQRNGGKMKDTSRNALFKKEFVIHIADETYIEQLNQTAKPLAATASEVAYADLTPVSSVKIAVPGLQEASIRMECLLEKVIPLGGTNEQPSCDLLIGRVVQYHIREQLYSQGRIDPLGLKPIGRLAGNAYTHLGKIIELTRPIG